MACELNELKEALRAKAVKGKVEGIPLDIAVIRLTAAVTKMQVTERLKDTEGKFEIAKKMYEASILAKAMKNTESEKPELNKLPTFDANKKTMTYAGIGSRNTPAYILEKMTKIAAYLEKQGYTLNTGVTFRGKEEGADKAFSDGTKKKNLFSPEKQGSRTLEQTIAKEVYTEPENLTEGVLKLMARSTNQVFGDNLDTPVDFVLFYAKETKGIRPEGGTGQAVEIARLKGIPTVNMAVEGWETELRKILGMSTKEVSPLDGLAEVAKEPSNTSEEKSEFNKLPAVDMNKQLKEEFEFTNDNQEVDDKAPWEDEGQEETVLYNTPPSGFYREKYVQPTLTKGQVFAHVSNAKFDKFAVAGDVLPDGWEFNTPGSHIGDSVTVDEYAKQLGSKEPTYVYDVMVKDDVKVLEMKDPGDSNWTANNMYDQLVEKFGKVPFTKDSKAKEVLDFLRSKGYDAVGYVNTEEGGVSYMVLSPDKFELKLRTPIATKGKVSFSENLLQSINKCNK